MQFQLRQPLNQENLALTSLTLLTSISHKGVVYGNINVGSTNISPAGVRWADINGDGQLTSVTILLKLTLLTLPRLG